MDENRNSRVDYGPHDAVVVAHQQWSYGNASGAEVSIPASPPATALSLLDQLRYFYCEHLKGIFFIALSLAFGFLLPVVLTRPERIKVAVKRFVKRCIDLVGAGAGLLLSLPFFVILPILIKLDSAGPVFYTQLRVGVNRRKRSRRYCQRSDSAERRVRERRRQDCHGKPFHVIKFRTMVPDAERESGPVWATTDDLRTTRLGRILRKTRLDEIPQFINVLKGDMALVGPRPERPNFVDDLSKKVREYSGRLAVKPGITGLAQVENGYDTSLASVVRKVNLDLEYIRRWSLWADVKILCRTVVVVLTGKGAC